MARALREVAEVMRRQTLRYPPVYRCRRWIAPRLTPSTRASRGPQADGYVPENRYGKGTIR
jgi:hypothetical protein